ncbi:unnamed protein product [Tuwongella immobilis]|uniref:Uncharacterized protein n=1 Tax=Tuwongella immobilis TaxID=692036 RepID=A0A6C2YIE2_9BACT|nr:unnamed protein product [Tuwongella immobilis]VTR97800.1 unnamed protein product [Tuwongella immobilis]
MVWRSCRKRCQIARSFTDTADDCEGPQVRLAVDSGSCTGGFLRRSISRRRSSGSGSNIACWRWMVACLSPNNLCLPSNGIAFDGNHVVFHPASGRMNHHVGSPAELPVHLPSYLGSCPADWSADDPRSSPSCDHQELNSRLTSAAVSVRLHSGPASCSSFLARSWLVGPRMLK